MKNRISFDQSSSWPPIGWIPGSPDQAFLAGSVLRFAEPLVPVPPLDPGDTRSFRNPPEATESAEHLRSRSGREVRSPWSSRAAAAVQATRAGLGLFPDPNPVGLETSPAVVPRWVYNIPKYAESTGGYFDTFEVDTIINLLKIIDNPMQDIPLISVMYSPIYNFTSTELSQIRLVDRELKFYELLMKILEDEDIEIRVSLKEKIAKFISDLKLFIQKKS